MSTDRLRATNYLDSVYWSYLRQLITMERSARQMRGRWAPSKGPAVGSASNLADGDTRDTLARLSFLPASPTPNCWSSDCVLTDGSLLLLTIHTTCTSAATLSLSVKPGFSDFDGFPWQPPAHQGLHWHLISDSLPQLMCWVGAAGRRINWVAMFGRPRRPQPRWLRWLNQSESILMDDPSTNLLEAAITGVSFRGTNSL